MPVNTWNFYRAVSVGDDHKSWLSQNPQVEDGRIGGNQPFDQEVTDQYQYEVNHMMRRLRLNFYRAEDAFLVLKKKQWAEEDKEFSKKQQERKRKSETKRMIQNRLRRQRKEMESNRRSVSLPSLVLENITEEESWIGQENSLDSLRAHFKCPLCKKLMKTEIFQCVDGHIWCDTCAESVKTCHECNQDVTGRNYTMEKIASLLLADNDGDSPGSSSPGSSYDGQNMTPTAPGDCQEDVLNLTSISDTSV